MMTYKKGVLGKYVTFGSNVCIVYNVYVYIYVI